MSALRTHEQARAMVREMALRDFASGRDYPRDVAARVIAWRQQKAAGHFATALRLLGPIRAARVYSDQWVELSAAMYGNRKRTPIEPRKPPAPRRRAPVVVTTDLAPRDPRLPPPGTVIERLWGGMPHRVTVGIETFDYQDVAYGSLSAVAKAITGEPTMNGFAFFGLDRVRQNA